MNTPKVAALGYIGFRVTEPDAWHELLTGIFGLECSGDAGLYRLDDRQYRLALRQDTSDGLDHIGWEVSTPAELEALVGRIESQGVPVQAGDAALRERRAVEELFTFTGPDDVACEIFHGLRAGPGSLQPANAGYKTGSLGLGHVVLAAQDPEAAVTWYCDVLGFELSDRIHWDEARATFLHCNPRHHSLAVLNTCFGMQAGQINHVMLEANALDDVGRAYDRVLERGIPLALTLGRHSNDGMISFYLVTPSGFWIEYGFGGVEIGPGWKPRIYDSPKVWGHLPASR